jgi:branched-chain amino acid transport system permease protein
MNLIAGINTVTLGPALVNGLVLAALYGGLATALVLSYRMSRSIAFVHGGIATLGAFGYWYLSASSRLFSTLGLPRIPSLLFVVVMGGVVGLAFGSVVSGRMATWPRVTVTTFSLGGMLVAAGIVVSFWKGIFEEVASPFGGGTVRMVSQNVTVHQLASIATVVVLVAGLTFMLQRTRLGVYIRAIADDIEAAEMAGIPVRKIAVGVWCFSGALAALAGALIVPTTRLTELVVLFVMLRSLAAAVLGGFDSLPLALGGAVVFGMVESVVGGSVFGPVSSGTREVILMTVLFAGVLLLARRRSSTFNLMES